MLLNGLNGVVWQADRQRWQVDGNELWTADDTMMYKGPWDDTPLLLGPTNLTDVFPTIWVAVGKTRLPLGDGYIRGGGRSRKRTRIASGQASAVELPIVTVSTVCVTLYAVCRV